MRHFSFLIVVLLFTCQSAFTQTRNFKLVKNPTENPTNEKRKAVVIGMSDYGGNKSLDNTINDADDMSNVLTHLGFEVILLKNNDLRNLRITLAEWYNTIERNDMAIFYFAGHGMEINGENYLVPVDAVLNSERDVLEAVVNICVAYLKLNSYLCPVTKKISWIIRKYYYQQSCYPHLLKHS